MGVAEGQGGLLDGSPERQWGEALLLCPGCVRLEGTLCVWGGNWVASLEGSVCTQQMGAGGGGIREPLEGKHQL